MVPNSVSYCRAEPSKVPAAAPRPRKKGRFRVAISDRPPSPPWDPQLGEGKSGNFTKVAARPHVVPYGIGMGKDTPASLYELNVSCIG